MFAEYLGLIMVAVLVLSALWAMGLPETVSTSVPRVLCRILDGADCGSQASGVPGGGQNHDQSPTAAPTDPDDPTGQTKADDQDGDGPTLADLQGQAEQAQQQLGTADDGGDVKQQIVDLLKDFTGVTDVQKCLGDGDAVSCLWGLLDVGSVFVAVLKVGKFLKAVEDGVNLWKRFNRIHQAYDRLKTSAERLNDLLRRRKLACGLPAAFLIWPHAPPTAVVPASLHISPGASAPVLLPAALPAAGGCDLTREQALQELAKAKNEGQLGLRAHEALGGHTISRHIGKTVEELRHRLAESPEIRTASSFTNYDVANQMIGDALRIRAGRIRRWLQSGSRLRFDTRVNFEQQTGVAVRRDGQTVNCQALNVVLERDTATPDGYRIVTSYPVV